MKMILKGNYIDYHFQKSTKEDGSGKMITINFTLKMSAIARYSMIARVAENSPRGISNWSSAKLLK